MFVKRLALTEAIKMMPSYKTHFEANKLIIISPYYAFSSIKEITHCIVSNENCLGFWKLALHCLRKAYRKESKECPIKFIYFYILYGILIDVCGHETIFFLILRNITTYPLAYRSYRCYYLT